MAAVPIIFSTTTTASPPITLGQTAASVHGRAPRLLHRLAVSQNMTTPGAGTITVTDADSVTLAVLFISATNNVTTEAVFTPGLPVRSTLTFTSSIAPATGGDTLTLVAHIEPTTDVRP